MGFTASAQGAAPTPIACRTRPFWASARSASRRGSSCSRRERFGPSYVPGETGDKGTAGMLIFGSVAGRTRAVLGHNPRPRNVDTSPLTRAHRLRVSLCAGRATPFRLLARASSRSLTVSAPRAAFGCLSLLLANATRALARWGYANLEEPPGKAGRARGRSLGQGKDAGAGTVRRPARIDALRAQAPPSVRPDVATEDPIGD